MKITNIAKLTENESRVLHAIERSIAYWNNEVTSRNCSGRDEHQRDLCCEALRQMNELHELLLDRVA